MMDTVGGAPGGGPEDYRRALRASEASFRHVIEKNADGMIVVRRDGTIVLVNPAARELLGRGDDQLLGQTFGVPVVPGETTELDIRRAGGEIRAAEMRVVELDWEGEPAYLASLRDITERKRMEEELRRRAAELVEADRRKDEFLAMLAHELRNPMSPILVAVQIMRLRADDRETQERMRDTVEHQVRLMARLVDDLLDVSRIMRGKVQLRREPTPIDEVVARAVETARPLVESRGHELAVALPEGKLCLDADATRLEQVLVNLLNNAAKYTDPGGKLALEAERDGDVLEVRVRDNGVGIDAELLPHVFDLFTQADRSLDRSQGGLGIGLTLVKSVVELHGGTVRAESDGPGQGSRFVVRLPGLLEGKDAGCEPPPAVATDGAPRRILVVDDNPAAAESTARLVGLWGHQTRVAHDGPSAIEEARAFRPEVALLDIGLPGMDGYELARRLRALPGREEMLLVAVTGYGREEDRQRCWEAGFDHHLVKPLDGPVLQRLLAADGPIDRRAARVS